MPDLPRSFTRRHALGAAAAAVAAWPRFGHACEVQAEFLRVLHPWTRATAPDASWAVLCMTLDQVTRSDRLLEVHTPIARGAELAQDGQLHPLELPVPAGQETVLSEEGTHVRLTGLSTPLHAGRAYPLMLRFRESGVVLAQLNVDFTRFR